MSTFMSTGWVNELSAGPVAGAKGFMFFVCNMELTTDGQGNYCTLKGYQQEMRNQCFLPKVRKRSKIHPVLACTAQ